MAFSAREESESRPKKKKSRVPYVLSAIIASAPGMAHSSEELADANSERSLRGDVASMTTPQGGISTSMRERMSQKTATDLDNRLSSSKINGTNGENNHRLLSETSLAESNGKSEGSAVSSGFSPVSRIEVGIDGKRIPVFGAGNLKEYFPNAIAERSSGYDVFLAQEGDRVILEEFGRELFRGLATAEYDFGVVQGEVIKRLVVLSGSVSNAFARDAGNSTCAISLYPDLLTDFRRASSKETVHYVLYHEAAHCLEESFRLFRTGYDMPESGSLDEDAVRRKSMSELATLALNELDRIRRDTSFTEQLNERKFLADQGIPNRIGHSSERQFNGHPRELFASFMTSTRHPDVVGRVRAIDREHPGFAAQYAKTARLISDLFRAASDARIGESPAAVRVHAIERELTEKGKL